MRVMIYGAGAMGTVLGAYLSKNGIKVDLVSRNRAHVDALNGGGAHIVGTADFTAAVNALTPDGLEGAYDIIFLMIKQVDNADALAALKPRLAADGVVCTMQNGLPEPSVAAAVGENRCCGCAVSWGATFKGAGVAELTTETSALQFALGKPYPGVNCKNFEEIKRLLSLMGKVTVEENFMGARWIKLAINCAFSSLSAMSGLTFGQVAHDKLGRAVALEIFNECIAVCRASGVKPEKIQGHDVAKLLGYRGKCKKFIALRLVPLVMKNHSQLVSGMLFDLKKGKKCEVEFINGAAVSCGKRVRLHTPFNSLAVNVIREIERGDRAISPDNIELFKPLL